MTYVRCNINTELRKAAKGKKTKLPVGIVIYEALRGYPAIQRSVAKAFSITED